MVSDCSNLETLDISGMKEHTEDTVGNMVGSNLLFYKIAATFDF